MKEIAYSFYVFFTDLLKLGLVMWGIMNFSLIKNKKKYLVTGMIQILVLIISGYFNTRYPDISTFVWTFTVVFSIGFMFQGRFFKKLGYSLLAFVLILFLDTCIIGISSILFDKSGHEVASNTTLRFIYNAVNILTIGSLVLIKKLKKRSRSPQINISKSVYALLFTGAATGFLTLAALLVRSNNEATDNARRIMVIVTIVAVFSYMAACLMIVIVTESRDKYKALSIVNQNIIESQQKYYTLVKEKQQEIRSIRHEMKNHLACLHALYQANKLSEMEYYIDQLIETSDITGELFDTGNDIVNAILNDAQSKCKKDNIMIRLEGDFPKELHILPMDMCVIFANIVSNAVEAIQRMERDNRKNNYIDIRIRSYKDDLYIDIRNPIAKNAGIDINKLHTSKQNKNLHGFGVKNVIQLVEKYRGTVKFRCENDEFFVELEMKNKE